MNLIIKKEPESKHNTLNIDLLKDNYYTIYTNFSKFFRYYSLNNILGKHVLQVVYLDGSRVLLQLSIQNTIQKIYLNIEVLEALNISMEIIDGDNSIDLINTFYIASMAETNISTEHLEIYKLVLSDFKGLIVEVFR